MSIEDLTGTVVRKVCMACSREFAVAGGVCPHDGNMLVALPQDPYVGRRIADKYHILSVLGTGGMGVVYLARHETMEDNVAIKMLRAQFVGDQASVKRFNHEAIAARRLRHPNVITTYDHGCTHQGQPYIVMECLTGTSLADEIKRCTQLSVERVVHIFTQACDALEHAHKQGVIHRDLKPGNFMLSNFNEDRDFVKVVDFGVAKVMPINNESSQVLTQAGEVCGSPVYMSPEQCVGQALDRRADVYSMGVVLYEALTGKLPLLGRNMVETMHKHMNEAPPSFKEARPDLYISERIEQVVMRALSKKPELRQQSMAVLKQELLFCVPKPGQGNSNLRTITSMDSERTDAKRKWMVPALVAVLVLSIIGAGCLFMGKREAVRDANVAAPNANGSPSAGSPTGSTGAPTTITGSPTAITGSPTAITGSPTAITGSPTAITGSPTAITGPLPTQATTPAVVPVSTTGTELPAGTQGVPLPKRDELKASKSVGVKANPAVVKKENPPVVAKKPHQKQAIAKKPAATPPVDSDKLFEHLAGGLSYRRKN